MQSKLDAKSMKTYFIGYSSMSHTYRFWEPISNKIIESADYIINENSGKYPHYFLLIVDEENIFNYQLTHYQVLSILLFFSNNRMRVIARNASPIFCPLVLRWVVFCS